MRWCDSLVLVYPTWWFNIPAILKGFFDRCFVPGVGFRYNKELGKRETGLQNIQQVGILTTYGFSQAQIAVSGDAGRRMIAGGMPILNPQPSTLDPQPSTLTAEMMAGGMRMLFAKDCTLKHMALYEMQAEHVTAAHRTDFLREVEDSFEKW